MSLLQPVRRARSRSLWLQEALAAEPDAEQVEPLSGGHRADVCIVGGGYTGLWTALQIKWRDPSVDVMLLEADICGAGASGRSAELCWYRAFKRERGGLVSAAEASDARQSKTGAAVAVREADCACR